MSALVGAAGLLCSGAPAGAQESGGRTLEPFEAAYVRMRSYFDGAPASPEFLAALPEGAASQWRPRVGVGVTYTDNVDLEPEGTDAVTVDGTAGLSWLRRSPRFQGSLDGRYSAPVYRSEAVEDRELTSRALAGAFQWQAARNLRVNGRGDATQNVGTGLEASPQGVPSDHQNRFDAYTAGVGYDWQPSAALRNSGTFDFRLRDYRSHRAEGEDTRSTNIGEGLRYQASLRDALSLDVSWSLEEELDTFLDRTNHVATVGWTRDLRAAGHEPPESLAATYRADRGLDHGGSDYWSHALTATYSTALSQATEARATGGYEWVRPDEGDAQGSWNVGLQGSHRFSSNTSLALGASQALEYAPISSETDRTTLTRVRRVNAALTSRWSRDWEGTLGGAYEVGRQIDVGGEGENDLRYWTWEANGSLRRRLGQDGALAARGQVYRRAATPSVDDYTTWKAGLEMSQRVAKWLTGRAGYAFSKRTADNSGGEDRYAENRVSVSVEASW